MTSAPAMIYRRTTSNNPLPTAISLFGTIAAPKANADYADDASDA